MAARRLHQQEMQRVTTALHRAINRRAQQVDELEQRLRDRIRFSTSDHRRRLGDLAERLRRQDVRLRFAAVRRRLERAEDAMTQCMKLRLSRAQNRLMPLSAHLTQLSPFKILNRGYAIVQNETGGIVKSALDAPVGASIRIRLAQGRLAAEVTESTPNGSSELPS
jgi:exodeoxyribonuclease VII large subunit